VESGKGVRIDTTFDSDVLVVTKMSYFGKEKSYVFETKGYMVNWIKSDGVYVESENGTPKQYAGDIRSNDFKKGLFKKTPRLEMISFNRQPFEIAVGTTVRIAASEEGKGDTPVDGTIRMFVKIKDDISKEMIESLLDNREAETEKDYSHEMEVRIVDSGLVSKIVGEDIIDVTKGIISRDPLPYSRIDELQDELRDTLNAKDSFGHRGLELIKTYLRFERTALENLNNSEVKAELSSREQRIQADAEKDRMLIDKEVNDLRMKILREGGGL